MLDRRSLGGWGARTLTAGRNWILLLLSMKCGWKP